MAILKNLLVNGSSRFLNKIYCSDVEISGDIGCSNLEVTGNITTGGDITLSGGLYVGSNGAYFKALSTGTTIPTLTSTTFSSGTISSTGNTTIGGNLEVTGTIIGKLPQYGYCTTAASTDVKEVSCSGFSLYNGAIIKIYFSNANTYGLNILKLNVNSTGEKYVYINNDVTTTTNQLLWSAGSIVTFLYNGTGFCLIDDPSTYYGASTTAASTAAKTDTTACNNAIIRKGTVVRLSMTNENTATAPTLNINGTGAKNLYAGNSTTRPLVSNGLSWIAGSTVGFVFDGAYWRIADTAGLASAYEASKVATNFITPVTNAGIQLHEANNTNDYYQIKTTGHYFYNNGTQIAAFQYDSGEEEAYYTLGTRALPSTFGSYSTTIGIGNAATSSCSTAIGLEAKAQGFCSIAMGKEALAGADNSIAIGEGASATGTTYSIAIGSGVIAADYCAIAIGQYTKAYAQNSMACGLGTVTTSSYSTAMGKYNAATRSGSGTESSPYTYTNAGDYAFIIGNGTGDATEDRSNALTVDWDGNLILAGGLTVNGDTGNVAKFESPFGRVRFMQQASNNRPCIIDINQTSGEDDVLQMILSTTGIEFARRNRSTQAWSNYWTMRGGEIRAAEFGFNITINSSKNGTGSFQISNEIKNGYLATIITQIWPLSTWEGADAGVTQIAFDSSNQNQINVLIASSTIQTYGVVARVLYYG